MCLDQNAEGLNGGDNNNNDGAPFQPTETEGPPGYGYAHNYEVACVVCALNVQ